MMIRCLLFYLIVNHRVDLIVTDKVSDDSDELKNAPPNHVIPYSEHEDPPEPSTKPKYVGPGEWAKPPPDKNVPLDFVPMRLYAQVRQTDTVKRVPREEALNEAKTDDEKENAGRLKEVVSKRKVNTVYTEEGYEDAAYDHGGHERDADFNESYEQESEASENVGKKKKKGTHPKESFRTAWKESGVDPKFVTENEIAKLEEDLKKEDAEAAEGAETEVPDNLRDLVDDSDYDNGQDEASRRDYDHEDTIRDSPQSAETSRSSPEYVTTTGEPEKVLPTFISLEESLYPTILPGFNVASTLKQLSSSEDPSATTDYGKVFWNYYKTMKPAPESLSEDTAPIPELQNPSEVLKKESFNSLEGTEDHYPSLSKIYETWKRRGVEQTYLESSPGHEEPEINEPTASTTGETAVTTESEEQTEDKNWNRPHTIIIRAPAVKSCNDSRPNKSPSRSNYRRLNHLTDSLKPEEINNLAGGNFTGIQPPLVQPLGQVTYADFLPNTYSSLIKPSVTQESGSTQETNSDISVGPSSSSSSLYRYHQHQQRHRPPTMTDQGFQQRLVRLIKMLPPSPVSRSQYAQYQRRNGNARPQHDLWPEVFRNYRPVFRLDGTSTGNIKKLLSIDKRLDDEKVPLRSVKKFIHQATRVKSINLRRRRSTEDLLNDAPRVIQEVIDKEVQSRFPDEDNSEENRSESSGDEENGKFRIQVPEFDFSSVIKDYQDDHEDLENRQRVAGILDNKKYPFYNNNRIPLSSALKYVVNPLQVPRKTLGGTEFYDSRDRYMQCDDIDPDLSEVLPEEEEPVPDRGPKKDVPRLRGLGDKLECLRDKYFDKNPLDNPLFSEKQIPPPVVPEEFEIHKLKSRVSSFSGNPEANVIRRVSRRPEVIDLRSSSSRQNQITDEQKIKEQKRTKVWNNHAKRYRPRQRTTTASPDPPYEKQVYEDVMGTIKNMANMYQFLPPISRPSMTSPKLKNLNTNPNYLVNSSRSRETNDQAGHMTSKPPGTSVPVLTAPQVAWRYNLVPYRTSRVSYRTRPRTEGSNSGRIVGYFKTVRVHKRSIDSSELDLFPDESRTISTSNGTLKRRMRRPTSTATPETSSQASEKVVYTIRDLVRHSKPRGNVRFGDFPIQSTAATEFDIRRNEPRYTPIRKLDDDIYRIGYSEKNQDSGDEPREDDEVEETEQHNEEPKQEKHQYNVHENIQEEQTEAPIVLNADKYEEDDSPDHYEAEEDQKDDHDKTEESPRSSYRARESKDDEEDEDEEDEEEENDKGTYQAEADEEEDEEEQMEKPSQSYSKGSSDESSETNDDEESSGESGAYEEEDKNVTEEPDGEKEFHRFVSRPFSPFESYDDPKYSSLGPRVHKPAFYHPPFSSVTSEKPWKYGGSSHGGFDDSEEDRTPSKYVFPWHMDDEDASEESKRYEKISGTHEFPWERRERLAQQQRRFRDRDDDEEPYKSGTMTKFRKLYPWERYDIPSRDFGMSKVTSYYWPGDSFDNFGFSSQVRPIKFSSRYIKPTMYFTEKKLKKKTINNNRDVVNDVTTKFAEQIPATSATFSTSRSESTTPTTQTTSSAPVYTVRSRTRSTPTTLVDSKPTIAAITSNPTTPRLVKRLEQPPRLLKRHDRPQRGEFNMNNRRRSRMTSLTFTTTPRTNRRRFINNFADKSTTPATRKVERRSKVSKEEIITKMSYPGDESGEGEHAPDYGKLPMKKEMVQKVSITTKETPEHIYRTEEIDKDGVKGMFISIIPNNNTESSMESSEIMAFDRSGRETPKDAESSNSREVQSLNVSLPAPGDAVQLSEHGTRKIHYLARKSDESSVFDQRRRGE